MKFGGICFSLLLLLPAHAFAQSSGSDELKRLQKCYAMFVKQRIQTTDTLWVKVANGTLNGTDACMQIFDKAKLGTDGRISKTGGVYDDIGGRVLATFLEFQRSQFEVPEYMPILPTALRNSADLIDANEPAYHFLYSLFKANEPFSNVVTRTYGIKALRFSNYSRSRSILSLGTGVAFKQGNRIFNNDSPRVMTQDASSWPVTLVETGTLVGLSMDTTQNVSSAPATQFAYAANRNVNEHFGAGVLGTQAYLAANNDKAGPVTGGLNSYRVFAKNAMSDLLCKTVPALRSSDVLSFVKMNSNLPFRQGISCMQCHATMDPMAGAIRNLRTASVAHDNTSGAFGVRFFTKVANENTQAAAAYPELSEDSNFSKRPADATLFYRSYDGSLVNVSVRGLDDLGQKISQTNDFYACAAKRYYRFLTGINVDLSDLSDPINAPNLSAGEIKYRNQVISLGQQLKQDQSLRSMLKSIIASETFIRPDVK
jgi:hypothetical protein